MNSSKRARAILAAPAVVLLLSSCALIEPAVTTDPPTAMEVCALGHTWQLDTTDLSEKLLVELPLNDVPGKAVVPSGGQTLEWATSGDFTITSDLVLTITAEPTADQVMTITRSYLGTITGQALINGDVAIPRAWDDSAYATDTTAVLADAPVEDLAYTIPRSDFDDVLGLVLTCDAEVLTVNPRGTDLIQRWTRAS